MTTPERVVLEPFLVAGITTRTNNSAEMNPETAQIPLLWTVFYTDAVSNDILNQIPNTPVYGVYHRYASDFTDDYSVTAGVGVVSTALSIEEESIETIEIAGGSYLAFKSESDATEHIIQTWQFIWQYFEQHPEIRRAYQTDFEAYEFAEHTAKIYIGIL